MDTNDQIIDKISQAQQLLTEASQLFAASGAKTAPTQTQPSVSQNTDTVVGVESAPPAPVADVPKQPAANVNPAPVAAAEELPKVPEDEQPSASEESMVGQVGTFDGEFVVMDNGKRFQVPPNYASKSKLVYGDKLKLMGEGDYNEFKMIEQVNRETVEGILTKKNNQWVVLVGDKEYRVVSAAIRFYQGEFGDKIEILLPEGYKENPPIWGAVSKVIKAKSPGQDAPEEIRPAVTPAAPSYTAAPNHPAKTNPPAADLHQVSVPSQPAVAALAPKTVPAPVVVDQAVAQPKSPAKPDASPAKPDASPAKPGASKPIVPFIPVVESGMVQPEPDSAVTEIDPAKEQGVLLDDEIPELR